MGRPRLHVVLKELQQLDVPSPHHSHRRLALLSMISGLPRSQGGVCSAELSHSPQPFVMYAAARRGHLESVVWLHHFSDYDQARALDEAALHGQAHVIAWLLGSLLPRSDVRVDFRIRDDPELGVMAWRTAGMFYTSHREWGVIKSRIQYSADALAAECGDLEGVRKLLDHALFGPVFDFRVAIAAASAGQLGILQFLEKHCPWVLHDSDALLYAVQNRHLGVAKWLVANTTCKTIDDVLVRMAAITRGDLHILEWMKEMQTSRGGGKLSALPPKLVQKLSNADSLLWLVKEQNLEVTIAHAEAAIERHDVELTKWIVARVVAQDSFSETTGIVLLKKAIKEGILELVRWFVEVHNVRSSRAFSTASQGPSVDVLEYIYEAASQNGVSIIPVILTWLTTENLDTLLWLLYHGFHQRLLQRNALDHVVTIEQDCSEYQRTLGMCEHDPRAELSDILRRRHMEGLMRNIVLFRRFVGMLIDVYDPAFLRRVTWLPMWALRQRSLVSLERLAEIGHPTVFSPKLFRRLLVQYRNDSIVRWYIEKQPELISTRVVQWGVKHDKLKFLSWIFQVFLPAYLEKNRETELLRNCSRAAIWTAARHRRYDVLRSIQTWTSVATDPVLWHGVAMEKIP